MSTTISVRLPDSVAARLKRLAKDNCRSVAETIMWILKKYDERELSAQEYAEIERPYIDHALKQKPLPTSVDELFHE